MLLTTQLFILCLLAGAVAAGGTIPVKGKFVQRCPYAGKDVETWVFTQNGKKRCFQVFIPKTTTTSGPFPVLVGFHGRGGNSAFFCKGAKMKREFSKLGIAFICPSMALKDNVKGAQTTWVYPPLGTYQGGPSPCTQDDERGNEIAYTRTILDHIQSRSNIFDSSKVSFFGFCE